MDIKDSIFERFTCGHKQDPLTKQYPPEHHDKGPKKCPVTWWARVRYMDPEKGFQDRCRRAKSRADALDKCRDWSRDIERTSGRIVGNENMAFTTLCDYYEKHYVKEAEYAHGEKESGLRSWYTVKKQLDMLRRHFRERPINSITYGDLRQFRSRRFATKTRSNTKRTWATVHRELALLRRVLNVAIEQKWLTSNPFKAGASLISPSKEKKRERIITPAEEKALLEACNAPKRGHLRAILIAALDTGCRRGELLKLRWRDVDLDSGIIHIVKFNTKTAKERFVTMSERLAVELKRLRAEALDDPNVLVFGVLQTVKKSFAGARKDAGIPELRFHDLRHTNATRLAPHMSISEVGRILGHEQPATTYRYINANQETINRAAAILNTFNSQAIDTVSDAVN